MVVFWRRDPWLALVPFLAQVVRQTPSRPLSVAEVINESTRFSEQTVTVIGTLSWSMEWTALTGTGCVERMNILNKPFACAASLEYPDCRRVVVNCTQGMLDVLTEMRRLNRLGGELPTKVSLTGTLKAATRVFIPYGPPLPPELAAAQRGEYRLMGFGHFNAFPVTLVVTDGALLTSPPKSKGQ
jgi:hypothetical protein